MTKRKPQYGAAILAVLLLSAACQKPGMGVPQNVPQTALQWTIVYNAALAKANRAVEQSIETIQRSGAITPAQARPIIATCGRIAVTSEAVRAITSAGTEATWNVDGPRIRALLAQVNVAALHSPTASQAVDLAVAALSAAFTLLGQEVGK